MAPLSRHAGRLGRVPAPSARRLVLLVAFLTVAALILRPDLIVVALLGGILLAGLVAALSRLTAYLDWVARRMPATAAESSGSCAGPAGSSSGWPRFPCGSRSRWSGA